MKDKVWFEYYGALEHISKREYLNDPSMIYVCTEEGDDECMHDIVMDRMTMEVYYTEV